MGTWYETCAVSHLPIVNGDEAMVFYLMKKKNIHQEWSGAGETDKWYTPIQLPFLATCNIDEQFETGISEQTEEIHQMRTRQKEFHDVMFVMKPMYDEIIKEMKIRNEMYAKFLGYANDFIEQSQESDFGLFWADKFRGNIFVDFFHHFNRGMKPLLIELSKTQDTQLKERMIELLLFHYGLQILRLMWHPGFGRGAQDQEYFLHKKLAELTIQKEQEVKERWLEDNMLDEDEDEDDITKTYIWYV